MFGIVYGSYQYEFSANDIDARLTRKGSEGDGKAKLFRMVDFFMAGKI